MIAMNRKNVSKNFSLSEVGLEGYIHGKAYD